MYYNIDFKSPHVIAVLNKIMIAKTPVAYIILDKNMQVHFINEYFLKLRKLNKEDVLGQYCYNLSNNGVPCSVCAVREAITTGKPTCVLRHDVLQDNTERYMDDYAMPLYNEDNTTFDYILEVMHNRTNEMMLKREAKEVAYNVIKTMTSILDKKDIYTSHHSADVSAISMEFAKYIGLSEEEKYEIGMSALLHDVGKVYTPDTILNKASKLTPEEFSLIQKHPEDSSSFFCDLKSFRNVNSLSRHHHEKWNGEGYPQKLKGEEIPLGARIIAIADTYDAMTSDRPYRKGLPHEVALEEIRKYAGIQFDPYLAEKFYQLGTEILITRELMVEKDSDELEEFLKKKTVENEIHRVLQPLDKKIDLTNFEPDMDKFLDKVGAAKLLANTPVYYSLIGEAFDVLYVSKSLAASIQATPEELVGKKCFEINQKNMNCFTMTEHGCLACPTVRAFHTKQEQYGQITEKAGDNIIFMDIVAVPIEIRDNDNKIVPCVMEIFFDRTKEVELEKEIEKDIYTIMKVLTRLAQYIEPTLDTQTNLINETCNNFMEYLLKVEQTIKEKNN